jgi:hypothetical protein
MIDGFDNALGGNARRRWSSSVVRSMSQYRLIGSLEWSTHCQIVICVSLYDLNLCERLAHESSGARKSKMRKIKQRQSNLVSTLFSTMTFLSFQSLKGM